MGEELTRLSEKARYIIMDVEISLLFQNSFQMNQFCKILKKLVNLFALIFRFIGTDLSHMGIGMFLVGLVQFKSIFIPLKILVFQKYFYISSW